MKPKIDALILKVNGSEIEGAVDEVAAELPVRLVLNGKPFVTLLCTPTELEELAVGFLLSEGLLRHRSSLKKLTVSDNAQFVGHLEPLAKIAAAYQREKRQQNLLDYDDLLVEGKRLLLEHEDVRRGLSGRYRCIMVDEYQDTNHLQAELVRLLAYTHDNVMAVGDDCQSIFSFRGANFRNIMDFPALFPDARVIKLEENYRSTQPILDLANAVIAGAREKYTKCLFSRQPDGLRPRLYRAASENEQSRLVVAKVEDPTDLALTPSTTSRSSPPCTKGWWGRGTSTWNYSKCSIPDLTA